MSIQIKQKIVGYDIVKETAAENQTGASPTPPPSDLPPVKNPTNKIVQMHEKVERPQILEGISYKIKTPVSEHAFYITINDIILNPGTPHQKRRPFEMFINSKNMDHYQWISALTLIVSAVFRKGGDVNFLVKELQSVFDPKGGYFRAGGKFMPSLVAEIGYAIETHLQTIGLLDRPKLDENQQQYVDQHREKFVNQNEARSAENETSDFPVGAQLCNKCNTVAAIVMDNCLTCLNCGDSKCS